MATLRGPLGFPWISFRAHLGYLFWSPLIVPWGSLACSSGIPSSLLRSLGIPWGSLRDPLESPEEAELEILSGSNVCFKQPRPHRMHVSTDTRTVLNHPCRAVRRSTFSCSLAVLYESFRIPSRIPWTSLEGPMCALNDPGRI